MTFKNFAEGLVAAANGTVIPLLTTLAAAAFIYGVFYYFILHGDSEDQRTAGRQFVLWGVLGFVVLFSVWGIVSLLLSTLNV